LKEEEEEEGTSEAMRKQGKKNALIPCEILSEK